MREVKLLKASELVKKKKISLRTLYRWKRDNKIICYTITRIKTGFFNPDEIK